MNESFYLTLSFDTRSKQLSLARSRSHPSSSFERMRLRYSLSLFLVLLLLLVLVVVPLLASARRATGHAFHGHHRRLRSSSPSLGTNGVGEDRNHQLLKNGARLRHLHERNQPCDLRLQQQQPQQQPTAGGREQGKVRRGYFVMPSSAAAAGGNSAGFGFGSALPSIGMMNTLSASWQQLQQQLSAQVEEGEADLEKRERDDFLAKGLERLSAAPSALVSAVGYGGYFAEEEGEGEEGEEWIEEEEWLDDLLDMDYFDDIPEEEEQEQEGKEEEKEEEEEKGNAELLSTPSPRSDDPSALLTVNNDDNEAEEELVVDSAAGDRSAGTGWWSFTNSWDMLSYESAEAEAAEAEQENVSKNKLVECRVPNDCAHVEGRPICMHNKALNMTVCSECDPTRGFKDCQCDASRYCVSDPLDPEQGSCRKYEESILGRPCDESVNGRTTELGKDDLLFCGHALYNPKTNHIRVVEWEGSCQRGTCYLCGEGPVSIAAISICPDARICLAGRYAYAPVGIFSWIYLNRNPVLSMTFVVTCLFIAVVIVGTLGGVCYVCIALARGNPHRWRRVPTTQPEMVF